MKPIKLEIEGLQSFKEKQTIDFEKLTEYGLFGIFGQTGSGKSTILDAMILALFDEIPRNKIDGSKSSLLNSINDNSKKMEVYYSFMLGEDFYEIRRSYKRGISKGQEVINSKDPILIKNNNILANKKTEVKNILNEEFGLDVEDFSRTVVLPQGKFNEFLKLRGKEKIKMLEKIFALEKYGEELEKKIYKEKRNWEEEKEKYKNQIIGKGEVKLEDIKNLEELLNDKKQILEDFLIEKKEFEENYEEEKKLRELLDKDIQLNIFKNELLKEKELIEKYKKDIKKNDIGVEFKEEIKNLNLLKSKSKKLEEEVNNLEKEKTKDNKNIKKLEEEKSKLVKEKSKLIEERKNIFFDIEELRKINELYGEKNNLLIKKSQMDKTENNLLIKRKEIKENFKNREKNREKLEELKESINFIGEIDKDILTEKERITKDKKELIFSVKEEKVKKEKNEKLIKVLLEEKKEITDKKDAYLEKIKEKNNKLKKSFAYKLYKELKKGEPCPVCGSTHHKKMGKHTEDVSLIEKEIEELIYKKDKLIGEEGRILEKIKKLEEDMEEFEIKFKSFDINLEEKNLIEQEKLLEKIKIETENKEKKLNELRILIIQKESEKSSLLKEEKRLLEDERELKNSFLELKEDIENKENEILDKFKEISKRSIIWLKERKDLLEKNQDEILILQKKIEVLDKKLTENEKTLTENRMKQEKIKQRNLKLNTELEFIIDNIHIKKIEFDKKISNSIFENQEEIEKSILEEKLYENTKLKISEYEKEFQRISTLLEENFKLIASRNQSIELWENIKKEKERLVKREETIKTEISTFDTNLEEKRKIFKELKQIIKLKNIAEKKYEVAEELGKKLKGRAFVEFLSVKKLKSIVFQASQRLKRITNGRYQLISDEECDFYVVDFFNEGFKRRCSTLSGGETFVVSLCLALALSNQMQLKGKVQLEFFFLDEGFGTLDEKLLDKVIESLENINKEEKLKVGMITHLEEMKMRIKRKLEVTPAVPGFKGSQVRII